MRSKTSTDARRLPAQSDTMDERVKLLLIEDTLSDPSCIREILGSCTDLCEVVQCGRIEAAISAIFQDTFDIAVLDPNLPGSTGVEAVRVLHDRAPDLPIIILSEHADRNPALHPAQSGVREYRIRAAANAGFVRRAIGHVREQKRVTRGLRRPEGCYRQIVESLNEGVCAVDPWGTITFCNPRMAEMLGSVPEELAGRSVYDFVSGECWEEMERHFDLPQQYECTFVRQDGSRMTGLVAASLLTGGDGIPCGSIIGVMDITERKRAEHRMQIMEMAVASSVSAIAFIDPAGKVSYVNPAFLALWGYDSADEVLGRAAPSFWDDECAAGEMLQAVWRDGQWTDEMVGKRRDGTTFDLRFSSNTVTDESGEPVTIMASFVDITERKRAEQEILTRNRQLIVLNRIIGSSASSLSLSELLETGMKRTLELMEHDVGLVYMLDAERKRALLQYHENLPADALARSRIIKVHHWPLNFVFIAGQARYIESSAALSSIESALLHELDIASLACIPLTAESVVVGALYIGSKTGQSFSGEEKTLLEAIGKEIGSGILKGMLHKRLEAANREANLYLDIMTHDIRNAENVANLYADLLIEMLDGEAAAYARKLQRGLRKSIEILANVSTIRRIHRASPEMTPCDLERVIRDVIGIFPDVRIVYEGTACEVWADDLISEVFGNLIGNSIKFGGPDVTIGIRVEEYDGENVLVSVEDTGPGVPDLLKKSIFHRFERGRSHGSGDGLGLYIAKKLIERYGGHVWVDDRVENRPELGAAFRFTLREVFHAGDGSAADDEYVLEEE
ncbi:PAS domain S-box protein [Methanoculleus sp. FWC-SCC1]|uniref:histidine kinase n=1 Tax=Methanoculleus frigidifontis TaxID=2584085 RepID=A0ABT8MCB0_9EURY|nr:PAS domain S-box protein [Methanoculleus sp. FWC-SCC1]MDN7025572.1 PAS domain S-box protein [Methanoculleus sp. FWC-SCC1]